MKISFCLKIKCCFLFYEEHIHRLCRYFLFRFFPVNLTSIKVFPQLILIPNASFLLVCDGFFKSSIVKITRWTKTAFKCSCIKQLHVQIKQCQFLLFDGYKSYLILHFTVPGFKSIVVSCFMKNTLLIYVPIYSCFLSLNLTLSWLSTI